MYSMYRYKHLSIHCLYMYYYVYERMVVTRLLSQLHVGLKWLQILQLSIYTVN